jgi:hypothetical protein
MLSCLTIGALSMLCLRAIGILKIDGLFISLIYGQFVAVPIRVIAGTWLAKNDGKWRRRALGNRSTAAATGGH